MLDTSTKVDHGLGKQLSKSLKKEYKNAIDCEKINRAKLFLK